MTNRFSSRELYQTLTNCTSGCHPTERGEGQLFDMQTMILSQLISEHLKNEPINVVSSSIISSLRCFLSNIFKSVCVRQGV